MDWEERSVAIDGQAGTGKSTLAKMLGARLGLDHLDTGATYRSLALIGIHDKVDLDDPKALVAAFNRHHLELGDARVILDGSDVTNEIRHPAISDAASRVATLHPVRQVLVAFQRNFVKEHNGAVAEGRDVGTVVLTRARLKVFLKADDEVRRNRRGDTPRDELEQRDFRDANREVNPLAVAPGAVVIDTSERNIAELVAEMEGLYYLGLPES